MYEVIVYESNIEHHNLTYKFHSWDETSRFIEFNKEHGFKCIVSYVLADEDRF